MKQLFILVLINCFLCTAAKASWRPLSDVELVKYADLIVVVSFDKELKSIMDKSSKQQLIRFDCQQFLKGKATGKIDVHGYSGPICKAMYYFNGKKGDQYLLFLKKHKGDTYWILNGEYGALPIKKKMLKWDNSIQDIDTVMNKIKTIKLAKKL